MKINNKTYAIAALLIGWASLAAAAAAPDVKTDVETKHIWFVNESDHHSGEIWIGSPISDNYLKEVTKGVPASMKDRELLGAMTGTATREPAIRYAMNGTFRSYLGLIPWSSIKKIEGNVLVTFKFGGILDPRLHIELSSF